MITTPCNPHAIKEVKNVIEYLSKAYSIYAYDLDLLRLLGTYYLNKNYTISALRYFREALEINSSDMYCLASFGHLLVKTKQYTKAILCLEKYTSKLKNNLIFLRICIMFIAISPVSY